jgi:hypothetical protein
LDPEESIGREPSLKIRSYFVSLDFHFWAYHLRRAIDVVVVVAAADDDLDCLSRDGNGGTMPPCVTYICRKPR